MLSDAAASRLSSTDQMNNIGRIKLFLLAFIMLVTGPVFAQDKAPSSPPFEPESKVVDQGPQTAKKSIQNGENESAAQAFQSIEEEAEEKTKA